MEIECAELEDGQLFQWNNYIYKKITDKLDSSGRFLHCKVIEIAFQVDNEWVLTSNHDVQNFNHYCRVQLVKVNFQPT
jgi:hypothetical protein